MAEQGYILDIDAKFLDNLKKADSYLQSAARTAYDFTEKFKDLAAHSGVFAGRIKALEEEVAKIGKLKVNDLGLATISVDAKKAIDNTNILAQRLTALKEEWLAVTSNNRKGSGLIKAKDLTDISKLQSAIEQLKEKLDTEHVSSEKQRIYVAELELYKRMVKEMMKSNKTLSDEEAKRLQKEFNGEMKIAQAILKQEEARKKKGKRDESKHVSDIRKEYEQLLAVQKRLSSWGNSVAKHSATYGRSNSLAQEEQKMLAIRQQVSARIEELERNHQKELSNLLQKGEQTRAEIRSNYIMTRDQITANDHNKIRADFQKLIHDQAKLSEAYHKAEMLRINGQSNGDLSNRIASREAAVNKQIQDMEMKHQDVLTDLMVQAEDQRTNIAVNKARHRAIEAAATEKEVRKEEAELASTPSGAMALSQGADSIAERKQAIKYLEKARNELKQGAMSAEEYKAKIKELNDEIKGQEKAIEKLTDKQKGLKREQTQLGEMAEKLGGVLAGVFAVSAIRGYINQVMKVRKEFELQQKSLEVLLQSRREANELWKQTLELGLKSPFKVSELITYTKQLAAYRIETDKLHDTTRMLADVSAGLGVDMSRLILAYGQVRSATFLRATELRQFTEAGVPMLDELAKHFEALEGRAVTTGDVFERISKRMVSFKDVEAVLQSMTSAGGAFFQMQEKQAQTLSGQISNLKDAISLALNDIGESNQAIMSMGIKFATLMVKYSQTWLPLLTSAGLAFVALRLQASLGAVGVDSLGRAFKTLKPAIEAAGAAFKGFAASTVVLLLIGEAVKLIEQIVVKYRSANKEAKRLNETISQSRAEFSSAFSKGDTSAMKKNIKDLADFAKREFDIDLKIDIDDLNKTDDELKAIEENMANTLETANAHVQKLVKSYADGVNIFGMKAFGERGKGDFFGDRMVEDIRQFEKTSANLLRDIQVDYKNTVAGIEKAVSSGLVRLTEVERAAMNALMTGRKKNESEYDYVFRMAEAYKTLGDVIEQAGVKTEVTNGRMRRFSKRAKEVTEELEAYIEKNVKDFENLTQEERDIQIQIAIDKLASENNWSNFIKKLAYKAANTILNVNVGFKQQNDPEDELKEWQKKYNDTFAGMAGFVNISASETTRDSIISGLREFREAIDKEIKGKESEAEGYADLNLETLKTQLAQVDAQLAFFNASLKETDNSSQKAKDAWGGLLRTVKDFYDKFTELNKDNDLEYSGAKAAEYYAHAFNEALKDVKIDGKTLDVDEYLSKYDLRTLDGVIQALRDISKYSTDAETRLSAMLAVGDFQVDKDKFEKSLEKFNLTRDIEDLFSGYELSIELDKLNIPKDFASEFFGIKAIDLSQLRAAVEALRPKFQGTERYKEYQEYLERITKMEEKAQEERLKTYLQYARDAVGERAKIKLEELRKLQEIEETFDKEHEPEKQAAIKKVQEDSYQATQKLEWEEFQKSDTFISLFEDLDSASSALTEHMIKKLEDFKDEWKNMPLEDMRSIVDKIGQLRTHLVEQDAFKWGKELRSKVKEDGRSEAEIQQENVVEEEKIVAYDEEIARLESILSLLEEEKDMEAASLAMDYNRLDLATADVKELRKRVKEQKDLKKQSEDTISNNEQALKDQQDLRKAYAAQAQYIQESQKMANDLYDAFSDIMDVLGQGDGMGAMFAQMGMDMANSVLNCIALQLQLKSATGDAHTFGAAMNTAMGVIGWIVMGVQLIGTALKAAFDAHDMRIDKQIQQLAENVEYLQSRFEEFEKALDKAFSTTQVESFTKALSDNIDRQIANYERMRKLEEDKKKADQSKIDDYNDAIKDLSEQRKEIFEEQQSKVTAGILDDALSAAERFVDAWYEAFKETGDGLSGLRENFKEMLTGLIKKQAAMQIVGHYTKMYSDWLAGYVDVAGGDAMLTADEAKEWAAKVKETMPELNAMLENFFSSTQELLQEEGSLSELSKGIQGVTESTAQVLEALLNSMRFYVADSNTQLKAIAASLTSNDVERNPLLNELRQQTALIRSIESMFDSVIGRGGSSHIGGYVKVKID